MQGKEFGSKYYLIRGEKVFTRPAQPPQNMENIDPLDKLPGRNRPFVVRYSRPKMLPLTNLLSEKYPIHAGELFSGYSKPTLEECQQRYGTFCYIQVRKD